ncbi:MAG: hypothetical protein ABI835_01045 [Chloroflexota bacterium]
MQKRLFLISLTLLVICAALPATVWAASSATGVALSAYSDCDSPAGLDIGMNTDGSVNREGGIVTDETGAVLMSFDQNSGFANYSGTFSGYNFSSPAWSVPAGTVIGLYAYVGSLPYSAANTIEWFIAYQCDTQQIVTSCYGAYGSCPQSAAQSSQQSGGCVNVLDGRLNNASSIDCGAPVVLFAVDGRLDIYGVGGGQSQVVISIPLDQIAAPSADQPLVQTAAIPGTGQPVSATISGGTVLIEAHYGDGKAYTILYTPGGSPSIQHIAW